MDSPAAAAIASNRARSAGLTRMVIQLVWWQDMAIRYYRVNDY